METDVAKDCCSNGPGHAESALCGRDRRFGPPRDVVQRSRSMRLYGFGQRRQAFMESAASAARSKLVCVNQNRSVGAGAPEGAGQTQSRQATRRGAERWPHTGCLTTSVCQTSTAGAQPFSVQTR
jgi:hypothetical protein